MVLKGLNLLLTIKGRGSPLLYGPGVCCLLVGIAAVCYPPLIITVYDIKFCAIKNSILSLIAETRRHNRNSITSPRQMIESHPPPHLHTCCWHSFTTGKIWLYCYTELSINSDKHVSIMVTPILSYVLSTAYRLIPSFKWVWCTVLCSQWSRFLVFFQFRWLYWFCCICLSQLPRPSPPPTLPPRTQ